MEQKKNTKSTWEILKTLCGRNRPEMYKRLTGLPEFDPEKHSDGCSGGMSAFYSMMSDNVKEEFGQTLKWRDCCVTHDRAYYYGGTAEEKRAADEKLMNCVSEKLGNKVTGRLLGKSMEMAVKLGGKPYYPTSYRWGYGEDFRKRDEESGEK